MKSSSAYCNYLIDFFMLQKFIKNVIIFSKVSKFTFFESNFLKNDLLMKLNEIFFYCSDN